MGESWDDIEKRVTQEVCDEADNSYAMDLTASMKAYRKAGFSKRQAWALLLEEHASRLYVISEKTLDALRGHDA